jgi:hypothetical protein
LCNQRRFGGFGFAVRAFPRPVSWNEGFFLLLILQVVFDLELLRCRSLIDGGEQLLETELHLHGRH